MSPGTAGRERSSSAGMAGRGGRDQPSNGGRERSIFLQQVGGFSATLAGLIIQHFGYAVPFYFTALLYATAATTFYLAFRGTAEMGAPPRMPEEAKGQRGEGPLLTE